MGSFIVSRILAGLLLGMLRLLHWLLHVLVLSGIFLPPACSFFLAKTSLLLLEVYRSKLLPVVLSSVIHHANDAVF